MMFYDFGNGSQELSLHQKLPTPKQLYFYILWIGCKDMLFEMFEMFFFSWEPFPGDVKSIKEFEFAGFISERFTLGNRYGSKNEAIQSHRVTFSKQLYKFETANIIYLQETCSNQVNLQSLVYLQTFLELMIYIGANMCFLLEINRKSK